MSQGKWPLQQSDIELIKGIMLETYEPSSKSFIPCEQLETETKPSYMHKTYFFRILQQLGYKSIRKRWQGKKGVSGYNLALKKIITIISTNVVTKTIAKPSKYQSFQGLIKDNKEGAAFQICDLHFGKSTPSYSLHIAEKRILDTCHRQDIVFRRDGVYNRCDEINILMCGDIVDGSGIYPTQTHHQEVSNALEQVQYAQKLLMPLFDLCRMNFKKWHIYVQAGNHGRSNKHAHEKENWDIALGMWLRQTYGADVVRQITIGKPQQLKIKNTSILLHHGNNIKSFQGIPYYGITRMAMKWRDTFKYDYLFMGHIHSPYYFPVGENARVYGGGSIVTDDDFSIEHFGHDAIGETNFLTFHPSLPNKYTYQTPVYYELKENK